MNDEKGPWMKVFDTISQWVQINLLFVLGTLIGGVVLGVFPALLAIAVIIRRVMIDGDEPPMLATFMAEYKQRFWKANGLGLIMVILVAVTLANVWYVYQTYWYEDNLSWLGVLWTMGVFLIVYIVAALCLYMPITHVYFSSYTVKDTIKFSLLSTLGTPLLTFQLLVIAAVSVSFFAVFRSAIPFLGVSVPLSVMMRRAHRRYRRFFIINESNTGLTTMNVRFLRNANRLMESLEQLFSEEEGVLDRTYLLETILQHPNFHEGLSMVVLDQNDRRLRGCLLSKQVENNRLCIALCVAHRGKEAAQIYDTLLALVHTYSTRSGYHMLQVPLDLSAYHPALKQCAHQFEEALEKAGYVRTDTLFQRQLRRS